MKIGARYSKVEKGILIMLVLATMVAWAYMSSLGGADMNGMVMDMDSSDDLGMKNAMLARAEAGVTAVSMSGFEMFVPMWALMCLAMMLPTAIPMIMTVARINQQRTQQESATKVLVYLCPLLFTFGYLFAWSVLGACVWVVCRVLFALLGSWINSDWRHLWLSVSLLFLFTGIYQVSPLKYACLYGCQHPFVFLTEHWRSGTLGAVKMGIRHAVDCIGCCIALMIVMLPLGMMNLVWMAVFTLLMFFEKDARFGKPLSRILGWIFLSVGSMSMIAAVLAMAFV